MTTASQTTPPGTEKRNVMGRSLVGLVLVAILPLLIFGGGIAWVIVDQKTDTIAAELSSTARALSIAVDRQLLSQFTAMEVLATDVSLDSGNLEAFRDRAQRVLASHDEWRSVNLIDPHTHQLILSTASLPGSPPKTMVPEAVDHVVKTRSSEIAGVFITGKVLKDPLVLMLTPVLKDGQVRYVISVGMHTQTMSRIFADQHLSSTWTGAVIDAKMVLAGRSRDAERYVGLRATPSLADRIAASASGMFTALNQEGAAVYTVFSRSPLTHWSVVIGVPAAEVEGPIRSLLLKLAAAGGALMAFSLILTAIVGRGIARRRSAYERALNESQSRLERSIADFADLVARVPLGIYRFRMLKEGNYRFDFVSEKWCGLIGVTADEVATDANAAFARIHPDDLAEFVRLNETVRTTLQPFVWEGRAVRPEGQVWLHIESSPTTLPNGDVLWNGITYDITERKRLEQEREQYWRFFQLSTDPMCIADPFGCFRQVNPAFVTLTGYSESDLVSKPFLDFVVAEDRQRTSEEMSLQVSLRPSLFFENRYLRKDGEVLYLAWTAYYDKDDGVTYATARDITQIKKAETVVKEARELVDDAQKMAQLGGWKYDVKTRRVTWTDEVYRIHGVGKEYNPADPSDDIRFYSPDDTKRITEAFNKAIASGIPYDLEIRLIRQDGERIWVRTTGTPHLEGNKVASVTGYIIDISSRKQIEQDLRVAATAFETQEGMLIADSDKVILRVNRAFTEITGYSADEAVGRKTNLLKSGRHDAAFYAQMWERLKEHGTWHGEIWNRRRDGNIYPEWLTITAVTGDNGEVSHYVGTLTDISLRKAAEDEIKHLAFYDPLTRLPNRRLLMDRLKQALADSGRSGHEGALLFVDLDNFKTLNDTLGHDVGDLLLQQVAQRLSACIREGDTVARLGGDEFVVMLKDLSKSPREAASQTENIGEKILVACNQPYLLAGHPHHSTPSIGATLFNDHELTVDELLKRADLAMYEAKASGRNTLRFFDPEMQATVTARATLEADLRQALERHEFRLYYQAQVGKEGHMTGAEALLRWHHPTRGVVFPAEFVPLAEETGLILPLGHWVLETACAQLAAWAAQPGTAHLTLAINVSARQLYCPDFVDQVLAVLARTGADPGKLKLELTERMLIDGREDIIVKMTALKAKGLGFSLDDFGTGYSSLSYLKRLPLDQLKIDQSFVRDILIDPNDATIAKTIVALARSMGLGVIAEGVETEAQRDVLAENGCQDYQGYLFSHPLPLEEFESHVQRG